MLFRTISDYLLILMTLKNSKNGKEALLLLVCRKGSGSLSSINMHYVSNVYPEALKKKKNEYMQILWTQYWNIKKY